MNSSTLQPATTPGAPVTRLGGQPSWLDEPVWPLSAELEVPMRFLAQVVVRDEPLTLAYVFMTDEEDDYVDTFEADGGENAVVIQPGGRLPDGVSTQPLVTGPTLQDDDGEPVELAVVDGDPDDESADGDSDGDEPDVVRTSGEPQWLQAPEHPGPGWRLAIQIDAGAVPAYLNFGDAGVGYAFVDDDLDRGVFLWQGA